jgi:hypothetical protein
MPAEPNKMRELLEACARQQQQRPDPGLELHPATRRLLQNEVRRVHGNSSPANSSLGWLFRGFWPGAAIAASVALLVVASVLMLRWPAQTDKARSVQNQETLFSRDIAPPAKEELEERYSAFDKSRERVDLALTTPSGGDVDPDWVSNSPRLAYGLTPQSAPSTRGFAPPAPARPSPASSLELPGVESPAMASDSAAALGAVDQDSLSERLHSRTFEKATPALTFSQVQPQFRQNYNSPPNPAVLTTFQFQQAGEQVRIIDADGSVYVGNIQPAQDALHLVGRAAAPTPQLQRRYSGNQELGLAVAPAQQAQSHAVYFQAIGTNRTLNQLVEFTGNFQAPLSQPAGGIGGGGQAQQPGATDQAGRIEGRATVGRSQFRIEATPVLPR